MIGLVLLCRGSFLPLNEFVRFIYDSSLLANTIQGTQIVTMSSSYIETVVNIKSGKLVYVKGN